VVEVSPDSKEVTLHEPVADNDYLARLRVKERRWAYDAAFGPNSSQAEIYASTAAPLVEAVFSGAANATCFCYGATGAGKTFTMLGSPSQPGVMVQALGDLFARVHGEPGAKVTLAYLEIYNENVRDLLAGEGPSLAGASASGDMAPSQAATSLDLREDPQLGVTVTGLTWLEATTSSQVMALLQRGNARRVTEPTRCNATSSRSHAVLQVLVTRAGAFRHTSKLSLIDLAGSERALATDVRTARSAEGAAINKSLLALSSCIHALVEGKAHVPYRNSKLTQLLKDSLGGGCRTAMIANVSPACASWSESQNTLHWADRAKEIRTAPAQATAAASRVATAPAEAQAGVPPPAEVAALRQECDALKARLEEHQRLFAAKQASDDVTEAEPPAELQRTRSRRRMADGSAVPGGMLAAAAAVAAAAILSPVPPSPAPAQRPPFLTASAPNFIVPTSCDGYGAGATPRHCGTPSRTAMAAELDRLRAEVASLAAQKSAAERAASDAEAAAAAARDQWAACEMEWDAQRSAAQEALFHAHAEAECLREALRVAQQQTRRQSGAEPCGELTNGVARLSLPGDGEEDAAQPQSVVKTHVRTFEHLASPAGGMKAQAHVGPVAPSPGRLYNTQLYARFAQGHK
jgi:hypothetical protein